MLRMHRSSGEQPTIIGINPVSFTGKDGRLVEGKSIFISTPLDPAKGGQGCSAEKIFFSNARLSGLDFLPEVGDQVEVLYNRYGKVAVLKKISNFDGDIEI